MDLETYFLACSSLVEKTIYSLTLIFGTVVSWTFIFKGGVEIYFICLRFLNYEVNLVKFTLLKMVNLIIQKKVNYKINRYTTFQDTSPRNHCAKSQCQRVDGFL